jgi:hypothetical protein
LESNQDSGYAGSYERGSEVSDEKDGIIGLKSFVMLVVISGIMAKNVC